MKKAHWLALAGIIVISLVAQFSVAEHHHWWDVIPAFYGIFGFLGGVILIVVSRWYGKYVAYRREDYYDR
jgi:hypothetical protein